MAITRETVLHVAKLAKLTLEPGEVEQLQIDLGKIVGYIDQLAELDTSNIEPTAHVAVQEAPRVADVVHESLPTETALAEGPRVHDDGFAVPAFVDEG
jgi:aspartyl-tRNA(Asn)/glutamyl-tRNA(Gln) amidotransferase subunit C